MESPHPTVHTHDTGEPERGALQADGTYRPRLGLEMEMAVARLDTGASHPVARYFDALRVIKEGKGQCCAPITLADRCVGLLTDAAECGLDNGFNLLETALAPVAGGAGGLDRLGLLAHRELADTLDALQADDACVLNVSQHPFCPRDAQWYARVCVPRPIYRELVGYRGWHHWEGIDAKAQNGVNTSTPVEHAAQSLNIVIALAAASIGLFANSPLESGRPSGLKENRLTIWTRVFKPARFGGDERLAQYPSRPFRDLGDYFRWMFQKGTVSRSLPMSQRYDYKSAPSVLLDGDPCLTDFLLATEWRGRCMDDGQAVVMIPDASHFEYSQIAQFLDARWRYRLDALPPLPELMRAWREDGGLENLFATCGVEGYIEGRAPGAGFADAALLSEAGAVAARSMLIAPMALQLGLLGNAQEAWRLVREWGWRDLGTMRQAAMRRGLADPAVRRLCTEVVSVARSGLAAADHDWLAYPDYVLSSGRTSADRLLETWRGAAGKTADERLAGLLPRHAALSPACYGGLQGY